MEHLENKIDTIRSVILDEFEDKKGTIPKEVVEQTITYINNTLKWNLSDDEINHINYVLSSTMNIGIDIGGIVLRDSEVKKWLRAAKADFEWKYWQSYEKYLLKAGRSKKVIKETEKIIDEIIDSYGDPRENNTFSRSGLVMGNVQSGKTQNYLGLINKSIDVGYKVIIVLGGHQNELRKQTQIRIDEGVVGRESTHLVGNENIKKGVGQFRNNTAYAASMTTTDHDFNSKEAASLKVPLNQIEGPIIFCIKKLKPSLESLYSWLKDEHNLDPHNDIKLDMPMLLIDDEADYASINTKDEDEDPTATNKFIRNLRTLFHKSTYIGYTATPFGNIFINPESKDEMLKDDLFPKDFMIRVPVPSNYMGQNHYFESEGDEVNDAVVIINDNEDMLPLSHSKKNTLGPISESLKDAIRTFIISCAVRDIRLQKIEHKTMMINITHLNIHQSDLSIAVERYLDSIINAIENYSNYPLDEALKNKHIKLLKKSYELNFNINEEFHTILRNLRSAILKIEVQDTSKPLDYSIYEKGLSVIVIGGHKLSRGLTLEGLSTSYFARSSKTYDTLMQMCRWFGYRPGYEDLCKVFLPQESYDWYSFISEAINDLYSQLERMSHQGKTPKDFGLSVRAHPGALQITARNKNRRAKTQYMKVDLWGSVQRRFRFYADNNKNQNNLNETEIFISNLLKNGHKAFNDKNLSSSYIFNDVDYDNVANFLKKIDLKEDDLGDGVLHGHIDYMNKNNFPKFKVVLFNQGKSTRSFLWKKYSEFKNIKTLSSYNLGEFNINLANRTLKSNGELFFGARSQLGSPSDMSIGLSKEAIDLVKKSNKSPSDYSYISSEERDYPLLIIYLFSIAVVDPYEEFTKGNYENINVEIPFNIPTVGCSISFPLLEHQRGLSRAELIDVQKSSSQLRALNDIAQQSEFYFGEYDD